MIGAIVACLCGFGSLFLGGSLGRARMRQDTIAAGQAAIGWICLVIVSIIAFTTNVE